MDERYYVSYYELNNLLTNITQAHFDRERYCRYFIRNAYNKSTHIRMFCTHCVLTRVCLCLRINSSKIISTDDKCL